MVEALDDVAGWLNNHPVTSVEYDDGIVTIASGGKEYQFLVPAHGWRTLRQRAWGKVPMLIQTPIGGILVGPKGTPKMFPDRFWVQTGEFSWAECDEKYAQPQAPDYAEMARSTMKTIGATIPKASTTGVPMRRLD